VAKFPGAHFGVEQATMNWWYGHNVLGLWFTPAALGAAYYFLPKAIGRRVSSYNLAIPSSASGRSRSSMPRWAVTISWAGPCRNG